MARSLITYNFEYEKKLNVCFIGAGGHSFRNIYPTFQYAPIHLLAICDQDSEKAASYAAQFGAKAHYTNHLEMLEKEKPDAVFIVTSYHPDGRVQATDLALDCLKAGAHVWMEKPTASSTEEIQQLIAASQQHNRYVMTGLKKTFFPSIEKVKEIIQTPEFGTISSIYIRYPQHMPPFEERKDLRNLTSLLDHIFHPGAIIHYLMGKIESLSYEWEPVNGGSVTNFRFLTGAVGTLHLTAGISGSSPLERLEVIGEGANIVVENGVKVTYYRKAALPAYGRDSSYLVDNEVAPLHWEPEFSLGQLYNKNLFYLGYVQEVNHFCESILTGNAPQKGTLEESLEILKLFQAYRFTEPGKRAVINS
ncbi:Gfo/Idh/MocA family oxidoreductase [Robertmurraya yapensis]|uniref:Gfo/Idh/MocA family oxidoreductase n=1 Tax=Bacillus yapensis TaxID=2492960 RepID=A0A431WKW3_9BACI|nr:Gfo/Idh/MocA family oxidoreductase [Bacillus yapensis]RTR36100.1 Gfo/Idh/MocA family oxidoreductase [Bacillus yapensis]TKT05603.1 Gfo/Idh/MocA family oxidoreductase [Bacillus yapensis]